MKIKLSFILLTLLLYCAPTFAVVETSISTTHTAPLDPNTPIPGHTTTTTTTTVTDESKPLPADEKIITAVYNKYAKTSALIGTSLTVTSFEGIVTIEGTVIGQAQADAAIEAAKSILGVKEVRAKINVVSNPQFNRAKAPAPNY